MNWSLSCSRAVDGPFLEHQDSKSPSKSSMVVSETKSINTRLPNLECKRSPFLVLVNSVKKLRRFLGFSRVVKINFIDCLCAARGGIGRKLALAFYFL